MLPLPLQDVKNPFRPGPPRHPAAPQHLRGHLVTILEPRGPSKARQEKNVEHLTIVRNASKVAASDREAGSVVTHNLVLKQKLTRQPVGRLLSEAAKGRIARPNVPRSYAHFGEGSSTATQVE